MNLKTLKTASTFKLVGVDVGLEDEERLVINAAEKFLESNHNC